MRVEVGQPVEVEAIGRARRGPGSRRSPGRRWSPCQRQSRTASPAPSRPPRGRGAAATRAPSPLGQAGEQARRRRPGWRPARPVASGPRVSARARARTVDLPSPARARRTASRWPASIVCDQPGDRLVVRRRSARRATRRRGTGRASDLQWRYPHGRRRLPGPRSVRRRRILPLPSVKIGPRLWPLPRGGRPVADRFYCPDPPDRRAALRSKATRPATSPGSAGSGSGEVVEVFDGRGFATRAEVVAVGRGPGRAAAGRRPAARPRRAAPTDPGDGRPQGGAVRLAGREGDRAGRGAAGPARDRAVGGRPARGEARPAPPGGRRGVQAVRPEPADGRSTARRPGPLVVSDVRDPVRLIAHPGGLPVARLAAAGRRRGDRWRSGRRGGSPTPRSRRRSRPGWLAVGARARPSCGSRRPGWPAARRSWPSAGGGDGRMSGEPWAVVAHAGPGARGRRAQRDVRDRRRPGDRPGAGAPLRAADQKTATGPRCSP